MANEYWGSAVYWGTKAWNITSKVAGEAYQYSMGESNDGASSSQEKGVIHQDGAGLSLHSPELKPSFECDPNPITNYTDLSSADFSTASAIHDLLRAGKPFQFPKDMDKTTRILSDRCWNSWANETFVDFEGMSIPARLDRIKGTSVGWYLLHQYYQGGYSKDESKRTGWLEFHLHRKPSQISQGKPVSLSSLKGADFSGKALKGKDQIGQQVIAEKGFDWCIGRVVKSVIGDLSLNPFYSINFGDSKVSCVRSSGEFGVLSIHGPLFQERPIRSAGALEIFQESHWLAQQMSQDLDKEALDLMITAQLSEGEYRYSNYHTWNENSDEWNQVWNRCFARYGLELSLRRCHFSALAALRQLVSCKINYQNRDGFEQFILYHRSPHQAWSPQVNQPVPLWLARIAEYGDLIDKPRELKKGQWVIYPHESRGILVFGKYVGPDPEGIKGVVEIQVLEKGGRDALIIDYESLKPQEGPVFRRCARKIIGSFEEKLLPAEKDSQPSCLYVKAPD